MDKHVLFVDDNPRQRDLFLTAVEEWNSSRDDGKRFVAVLIDGYEAAREALARTRFDCALFDLRLPTGQVHPTESPSGNELARIGLHGNGIPVGIISGKPNDLEEEFRNSPTVRLFFKGDPDDPYRAAVEWFADQWEMMDVLASARDRIRSSAADIFSKRVWPRWSSFEGLSGIGQDELSGIVTRQYVSHIAELLGIDNPDNAKWHPFEAYITPALQAERAHTGDIFSLEEDLWVVVTPQCDMATRRVKYALLCLCKPMPEGAWNESCSTLAAPQNREERKKIEDYFRQLVNQNLPVSEHFLPPLPGHSTPLKVSFKDVRAIDLKTLNESLESREAAIAPPFLGNLTQRFGAYISRMGQPNIDSGYFKRLPPA